MLGQGDAGKQIQYAKSEAVQRQIRADQKSGIDPFALRIGPGEKTSENQFNTPTDQTPHEK